MHTTGYDDVVIPVGCVRFKGMVGLWGGEIQGSEGLRL